MVTVRSAKNKGSQFEYSVRDSLLQRYPDILLTKQEGFVSQNDLIAHKSHIVVECKKHKGFSWNELVKYYNKLKSRESKEYHPFLVFQANRQPCLVMMQYPLYHHEEVEYVLQVREFEDVFGVPFIVHNAKKKVEDNENG